MIGYIIAIIALVLLVVVLMPRKKKSQLKSKIYVSEWGPSREPTIAHRFIIQKDKKSQTGRACGYCNKDQDTYKVFNERKINTLHGEELTTDDWDCCKDYIYCFNCGRMVYFYELTTQSSLNDQFPEFKELQ